MGQAEGLPMERVETYDSSSNTLTTNIYSENPLFLEKRPYNSTPGNTGGRGIYRGVIMRHLPRVLQR